MSLDLDCSSGVLRRTLEYLNQADPSANRVDKSSRRNRILRADNFREQTSCAATHADQRLWLSLTRLYMISLYSCLSQASISK